MKRKPENFDPKLTCLSAKSPGAKSLRAKRMKGRNVWYSYATTPFCIFLCVQLTKLFVKSPLNALLKATKMSENGEVSYWIFIFNVSKPIAQTATSELWKSRIAGIEKMKENGEASLCAFSKKCSVIPKLREFSLQCFIVLIAIYSNLGVVWST